MSFNNKLMINDGKYRTPITDMLNLEENNLDYKKNCLSEKVLRDTQIRNIHEMGEMKRELKNYESTNSLYKTWEKDHETIQKLTSQLQEMQDQMNSMNDSGEFQEVESNYSGRLFYVPSQPAAIPSSRSMLSRDERLPLDTWNTSGLQ